MEECRGFWEEGLKFKRMRKVRVVEVESGLASGLASEWEV